MVAVGELEDVAHDDVLPALGLKVAVGEDLDKLAVGRTVGEVLRKEN